MMNNEEKAALEIEDEKCIICNNWFPIEDGLFVDGHFICFRCFYSKGYGDK